MSKVGGESRWELWVLKFLEGRYADRQKTLARYKTTWRTWMIYLDKLRLDLPMHVTHVHCQDFIAWRQAPKTRGVYACGRNTAIYDLKTFGLIMSEAMRRGFITTNPARGLGLIKTRPREKPEINAIEEMRIRNALPDWPTWMGT